LKVVDNMTIPMNSQPFTIADTSSDNYFNNSLDITFGPFINGLKIKGFRSYNYANYSREYSKTYLNMSSKHSVIDDGNLFSLTA